MNLTDIDALFRETIANRQRYSGPRDPEAIMIKIQMLGGGVIFPLVEHGGDLLWRMTEAGNRTQYGRSAVIEKVERCLRSLLHPYGFEREFGENIIGNAKYSGKSPAWLRKRYDTLLKQYAYAHAKLPVYNRAQFAARKFSVLIGLQEWKKVVQCGRIILNMAKHGDWVGVAGSVDPKYVGA